MIMTPAAILKTVKLLEQQKNSLVSDEKDCYVYETTENGPSAQPPEYNFKETTQQIVELDNKIRALKCALNKHNSNSIVADAGRSPSELLIWIAQLNNELERVSRLARVPQKKTIPFSQMIGIGDFSAGCIYQIANYDVNEAKQLMKELSEQIVKLQMALDTHNLTQQIEIEI